MIYIQDIENAIHKLGIENSEICIHSSMKSFGDEVEDGADGIVTALLKNDCTVMTPAFSYDYLQPPVEKYMPERNGVDYNTVIDIPRNKNMIFYPTSKLISVESMGQFPKCILNKPNSRRGNHPINSFTAIGDCAEKLLMSQTLQDVYAPFRQLVKDDGYVLLMGVGLDRATIIHYAEQLAGRTLFVLWVNDQEGNIIPTFGGGCSAGFDNFESVLSKNKKEILVGNSIWQCYKANDIVNICMKAIVENPLITHCGNLECIRCKDAVLGGPIIDFDI